MQKSTIPERWCQYSFLSYLTTWGRFAKPLSTIVFWPSQALNNTWGGSGAAWGSRQHPMAVSPSLRRWRDCSHHLIHCPWSLALGGTTCTSPSHCTSELDYFLPHSPEQGSSRAGRGRWRLYGGWTYLVGHRVSSVDRQHWRLRHCEIEMVVVEWFIWLCISCHLYSGDCFRKKKKKLHVGIYFIILINFHWLFFNCR